jgi:hypothetical protein
MNILTKQAIGIIPGDTIVVVDSTHSSGAETTSLRVEKVNYSNDMVYISGKWGCVNFPKYTEVVVSF